jgi:hypothetical protein
MRTNGPLGCHLCERPIVKGSEVFLNQKPYHPGCAVVAAKEKKHGNNAHDACRSEEGNEARVVAGADPAGN